MMGIVSSGIQNKSPIVNQKFSPLRRKDAKERIGSWLCLFTLLSANFH